MIDGRPDLLIVGGLSVDRLADGSRTAGGTVVHGAWAVAAAGRRVATITVAGPEPEAAAAVLELAGLGPSVATAAPTSIRCAFRGSDPRQLVFESMGGDVPLSAADVATVDPCAVLLGPVAGELSAASVRACGGAPVRVAAIQGWLRLLVPGREVRPLPLDALRGDLAEALAGLDALVASDEDLAAVPLSSSRPAATARGWQIPLRGSATYRSRTA